MTVTHRSSCLQQFLAWDGCFRHNGRKISNGIKFFDHCLFWMVAIKIAMCDFYAKPCTEVSPQSLAIVEGTFLALKLVEVVASALLELKAKALLKKIGNHREKILEHAIAVSNKNEMALSRVCRVVAQPGPRHRWQRRLYHFLDFNFSQVFSYGYVIGDVFVVLQTINRLLNHNEPLVEPRLVAGVTLGCVILGLAAQYMFFDFRSVCHDKREIYSLSYASANQTISSSSSVKPPSCWHQTSFAIFHASQLFIFLVVADFYLQLMQLVPTHVSLGASLGLMIGSLVLSGLYGYLASYKDVGEWRLKQFLLNHTKVSKGVRTPEASPSSLESGEGLLTVMEGSLSNTRPLLVRRQALPGSVEYGKLKRVFTAKSALNIVNLLFGSLFVGHALANLVYLSFNSNIVTYFAFGVGVPFYLATQLPQFVGRSWHQQIKVNALFRVVEKLGAVKERDSFTPTPATTLSV